jgi:hypothetical protein
MLKRRESATAIDHTELAGEGATADPTPAASGTVYCFVEPSELRRLMSIMAGTELVSEMVSSIL